ncbi:MAG: hypothetical protein ABWY18_10660 [Tardiphaga sp.]
MTAVSVFASAADAPNRTAAATAVDSSLINPDLRNVSVMDALSCRGIIHQRGEPAAEFSKSRAMTSWRHRVPHPMSCEIILKKLCAKCSAARCNGKSERCSLRAAAADVQRGRGQKGSAECSQSTPARKERVAKSSPSIRPNSPSIASNGSATCFGSELSGRTARARHPVFHVRRNLESLHITEMKVIATSSEVRER